MTEPVQIEEFPLPEPVESVGPESIDDDGPEGIAPQSVEVTGS